MRISTLRPVVTDQVIVDWLQLKETFDQLPFTRRQTQDIWICSQPQASRRLRSLERYKLITAARSSGHGGPLIYRIQQT